MRRFGMTKVLIVLLVCFSLVFSACTPTQQDITLIDAGISAFEILVEALATAKPGLISPANLTAINTYANNVVTVLNPLVNTPLTTQTIVQAVNSFTSISLPQLSQDIDPGILALVNAGEKAIAVILSAFQTQVNTPAFSALTARGVTPVQLSTKDQKTFNSFKSRVAALQGCLNNAASPVCKNLKH